MRQLFFTLILGLLISQTGFSTEPVTSNLPVNIAPPTTDCTLPAPENLILSNITATSIDASWSPVTGAAYYSVEAYSVAGNTLLYSSTEYGTSHTLTGLPPGTEVRVVITPVCTSGIAGQMSAIAVASTDIIIDIVANGYQCPLSNPIVVVNALGGEANTTFDPDHIYHAEIIEENKGIFKKNKFYFKYESTSGGKITIFPNDSINLYPYGILVGQSNPPQQNSLQNEFVRIIPSLSNTDDICHITFSWAFSTLPSIYVEWVTGESGAIRKLVLRECSNTKDGHQRSDSNNDQMDDVVEPFSKIIFPNPFRDYITVNMEGVNTTNPYSISIFDATGRLIDKINYIGDLHQAKTISTLNIKPGMYFIQVDDTEKSIMTKVFKL